MCQSYISGGDSGMWILHVRIWRVLAVLLSFYKKVYAGISMEGFKVWPLVPTLLIATILVK